MLAQDSLLVDTSRTLKYVEAYPVVIEQDTLLYLTVNSNLTPKERAARINFLCDSLIDDRSFDPYLLKSERISNGVKLVYQELEVGRIFYSDSLGAFSNPLLAIEEIKAAVITTVEARNDELRDLYLTLKQIAIILIIVALSYLIYWGVNRVYKWGAKQIENGHFLNFNGIHYRNIEVLNKERFMQLSVLLLKVLRTLVVIILIYLLIPTVFSFFPQTEEIAAKLFSYIFKPINRFGKDFFNFLPDLILIILVFVASRLAIRFLSFWTKEVAEGRLILKGFYADWAIPSYNLARFTIYLALVVFIIQHLPGSNTPMFLGLLGVVGLTIALASSKPLSNCISGIFLTYMRAFKVGDRVKVDEASGVVTYRNLFITRIKTKSNEYITVPNSKMMDSYVVNYSSSEQELGLVVYIEFCLDASVDHIMLQNLLVDAALGADSIVDNPKPVLLITDIKPGKVYYKLNAYTMNSGKLEKIKSSLFKVVKSTLEEKGISF